MLPKITFSKMKLALLGLFSILSMAAFAASPVLAAAKTPTAPPAYVIRARLPLGDALITGAISKITANSIVIGGFTFYRDSRTIQPAKLAVGDRVQLLSSMLNSHTRYAVDIRSVSSILSSSSSSTSSGSSGSSSSGSGSSGSSSGSSSNSSGSTSSTSSASDDGASEISSDASVIQFEVFGVVQKVSDSSWTISGEVITVNSSTSIATGLKAGMKVEAEGTISNNAMVASKISTEDEGEQEIVPDKNDINGNEATEVQAMPVVSKVGEVEKVPEIVSIFARLTHSSELTGTVMAINGNTWTIGSNTFTVNSRTIFGDRPKVGSNVVVVAVQQANGSYLARGIESLGG